MCSYAFNCLRRCEPDYGIFVPANKVAKAGSGYKGTVEPVRRNNNRTVINHGKVEKKDQHIVRQGDIRRITVGSELAYRPWYWHNVIPHKRVLLAKLHRLESIRR